MSTTLLIDDPGPLERYGTGPIHFAGTDTNLYERHPRFENFIPKFVNNPSPTVDADPVSRGRLNVIFLSEYSGSLAERFIPACDVSKQISTARYTASVTSNMTFMMNGALTVGTTIRTAAEENFFLFGLTADQAAGSRSRHSSGWHYENEPETRADLDLIFSGHFDRDQPGPFEPLRSTLLTHGDDSMPLAGLTSYIRAQYGLGELYAHRARSRNMPPGSGE